VFQRLAKADFKPIAMQNFPVHLKVVEAHRNMESNAQIGKIVVTVRNGHKWKPFSNI
jgi:hypothetical protein